MGEIAEMMLDGTLCSQCGSYLGVDAGYPVSCCEPEPWQEPLPQSPRRAKSKRRKPKTHVDRGDGHGLCGAEVKASRLVPAGSETCRGCVSAGGVS